MSNLKIKSKKKLLKIAILLSILTIVYNVVEGIISIYFGFEDKTLALFGFGMDSFVEVLSGVGILHMVFRIKHNDEERDNFEKTALKITGVAFYLLTIGLLLFSISNLISGSQPDNTVWGIIVSSISIFVMWWLINAKIKVGNKLNSSAIISDAKCARICMQLSVVLLISSLGYKIFDIGSIDSIGSLFIAGISFREGREAFEKAKNTKSCCDSDNKIT